MRRALRTSASGTRSCPPRLRLHAVRVSWRHTQHDVRVHFVSATVCGECCALLRAAYTRFCLVSVCGERCAHLQAAHARGPLVSVLMCGERCVHLRAGRVSQVSAPCHERRRTAIMSEDAQHVYAGGSRTCPPPTAYTRLIARVAGWAPLSPYTPRGTASSRCPFGPALEHTLRVAVRQFD